MEINHLGDCILEEKDIIDGLYNGYITDPATINISNSTLVESYNKGIESNADTLTKLKVYQEPACSLKEFDIKNQNNWKIPKEYTEFDIANWLFLQCQTNVQKQRVIEELELFIQHNMIDVLICLKYLVDFMREKNIVWGVGRGSSIASYCLYLIGIHKIDSLKYNLDIHEFLKQGEK